ncbi:MAG: mechanosensitive ion channel family protein [Maricaulaceae bacterium]|nr:mechanosensitive ion channel family protein [Maricaulaceae bacterium]
MALVALAAGLLLRGVVARWLVNLLRRLARRTPTKIDEALVDAFAEPFKLVPVVIGLFIGLSLLDLAGPGSPGERIIQSLIAVTIFWALHNAVTPVSKAIPGLNRALTPVMIDWIVKAMRAIFIIVGAAAVLEIWSIPVGPILAGLGLFGVAVGLGAQDLFKNLIAGILILTERRFLPGDWIKVDGVVEGTVEKINFRSTVVRRFDRSPVYVPNARLADNAVTNFTRMTHRRIYWVIGVEYKTTTAQLQYIRDHVLDFVLEHPEFAKPPEVATFMRVDSFGPSSIDFMLYCFTITTNWGEWLRLKEELAFAIKRIVEEAGTGFAFPSQTIYMDDGAEVFVPPKVQRHARALAAPGGDKVE